MSFKEIFHIFMKKTKTVREHNLLIYIKKT